MEAKDEATCCLTTEKKPSESQLFVFKRAVEANKDQEEVLSVDVREVQPLVLVPTETTCNIFKPLNADLEWYAKCFDEFLRRSDAHDVIFSWIKHNLRSMVEKQLEGYGNPNNTNDENAYNILSIGSGSGELDATIIRIIRSLKFLDTNIMVTAVEPGAAMFGKLRDLVSSSSQFGTDHVAFRLNQLTSSEFIAQEISDKSKQTDRTLDLIHLIHVIYYIPLADLEATLLYYYQRLRPGGYLIILLSAEHNSMVANTYIPKWHAEFRPRVTSEAIQAALDSMKIPYRVETDLQEVVDVTPVFAPDQSEAGDLLLDFFTQCTRFRENASEETLSEGLDFVRHFCQDRVDDDKVLATQKWHLFIIKRP